MRLPIPLAASLFLLSSTAPAKIIPLLDPMRVTDQDFERNRDPALWAGLEVERRVAIDGNVQWQFWRIANPDRRKGPLWVVPHDDENGAFVAGLRAVKRWGGVMIAVDSGRDDRSRSARHVRAADGRPIDPNRSFTPAYPGLTAAILGAGGKRPRPIIALHTNAPGFDPALAGCGQPSPGGGSGSISAKLCNDRFTPRPARSPRWPWDDDDSVILSPYRADQRPGRGWCMKRLKRGDFNMTFERVEVSDGSLSNYAVLNRRKYLNFETLDRASDSAGIAAAGYRLSAMIDAAMSVCMPSKRRLVEGARKSKDVR